MTFDLQNSTPISGDELRDHAANLLASKYGDVHVEKRISGKKSDIYFIDKNFNRDTKVYVEAKDYGKRLSREQVKDIWADYSGILDRTKPSFLLLVTRNGISTDAEKYINEERHDTVHNTIWQLEDEILGITEYIRGLKDISKENKLDQYYIPTRAHLVTYDNEFCRTTDNSHHKLLDRILDWIESDNDSPVAILGGYGAGKTSFTKILAAYQATQALSNPASRRPVLIKLGTFSRYSNIEGILGAMFTHEYPVKSFSTRRFLEMNQAGRLLIILDGFDEMKHAMSWSDFRVQVTELKKLMEGNARVILLGRPSAFLSQEEHVQVLRGRRKSGDDWFKIPDWPEFIEYDVANFNSDERQEFIGKYLASHVQDIDKDDWIESRVREVSSLASLDEDIFSKPVHAKILTELALDRSVDLAKFKEGVSRWQLYELFFGMLAEREVNKEARRAISDKARLGFLREIAFWLWTEMQGVASFASMDVPDRLLANLPFPDASDIEIKRREYLTGSFLEKKDGDVFYFSHRSFAEFLVAQRMVLKPPAGELHAVYGALVQDGVESFLSEPPASASVRLWANTLSEARGDIPVEYLRFLAKISGGIKELSDKFPAESHWRTALEVIGSDFVIAEATIGRAIDAMRTPQNSTIAVLYSLVTFAWQLGAPQSGRVRRYGPRIVAALLDRLFEDAVPVPNTNGNYRINKNRKEAKDLAVACVNRTVIRRDKYIIFDWAAFEQLMADYSQNLGFTITGRDHDRMAMIWTKPIEFAVDEVARHLKPANRQKLLAYYAHHKTLDSIDIPGVRR